MFVHQHPDRRTGPGLECTRMNRRGTEGRGCHTRPQCLFQSAITLPTSLRWDAPRCRAGLIATAATDKTRRQRSGRARHVRTPALSEPRTRACLVSPYEGVHLVLDLDWKGVRHPHSSHVSRRQERGTILEQRSLGIHETEVVERDVRCAVSVRRLAPTGSDTHPGEAAGDPLVARIRAIHSDAQHSIVVPRTALSHAVMDAEDPAAARIASMRSTIDEPSQRAAYLVQRNRHRLPVPFRSHRCR